MLHPERLQRIEEIAKDEGYLVTKVMNGKVYGLNRFMFTVGLVVGIDETGYAYQYCYDNYVDALVDFQTWNGEGHPSGDWIKCKGWPDGDISNPATTPEKAKTL